jgi:predicted DNA-binding protein
MQSKPKTSSKQRLIKIPVQAYLEPEQAMALKALAERTRIPQQFYIREGIEAVLAKYGKRSNRRK